MRDKRLDTKKEERRQPLSVQKATLARLPQYYTYLRARQMDGCQYVTSSEIAESLKLSSILVRKDLEYVSKRAGKPRMGFEVEPLIRDLVSLLGYNNSTDALLVGVGRLGKALLSYGGFEHYGLNIVAGFDAKSCQIGEEVGGRTVLDIKQLPFIVRRLNVLIGIITVPGSQAQEVADLMVEAGIKAIWNFAPVHIHTPPHILVRNENLAASLASLSKELEAQLKRDEF